MVMAHDSVIRDSHSEYDSLRQLARSIKAEQGSLDDEMRQINPDYVCWLLIDGTAIDYPVVRGKDNEKYIKTSFKGEANIAGTLFMDYRNTGDLLSTDADESMRNILIYAHNVPQGGMFSELQKLISSQFLEENNIITLIVDDQEVKFKIFSVRVSDINDPAYFLNFSSPHAFNSFIDRIKAPITATQIITLSTCTRGGSNTARLIVQGYRLLD
jgi:sortase B